MNYEYWFDLITSLRKFLSLSDYILIFLYVFREKHIRIPSIKFWALTILVIGIGDFYICDIENGIWTIEGCFQEIEELLDNKTGDNP